MYKIQDVFDRNFNRRENKSVDIHLVQQQAEQKKNAEIRAAKKRNEMHEFCLRAQAKLAAGNVVKVGY